MCFNTNYQKQTGAMQQEAAAAAAPFAIVTISLLVSLQMLPFQAAVLGMQHVHYQRCNVNGYQAVLMTCGLCTLQSICQQCCMHNVVLDA